MATIKLERNEGAGNLRVRRVTYTGPASYASNGDPLTAADFGLSELVAVLPIGDFGGNVPVWDGANGKLKFYRTGTSANTVLNEVAAAQNLSAISGLLVGIGA